MADLTQDLQAQIMSARERKQPLSIVGGGSKSFMGRATQVETERLDVSGHRGIISYEPVELVMRARAGTPLREIEAALAEHNQVMAFEPPFFTDHATIGGTLACNQSGPARPWTGSIRDHVLGIGLINGVGDVTNFGGQVMKNVAGYDVSRLQAGAMGTLGLITDVSFKVLPAPAMTLTLVWQMSAGDAIHFINNRGSEPKPVSAACWLDGKLYVRLSGESAAVEATATQWQGEPMATDDADRFWQQLRDHQLDYFTQALPLWRFSIGSTAALGEIDEHCLIDWGGAQRWYAAEADKVLLQRLAAEAGGQVSLFAAGDRVADVMHPQPKVLQTLQKRIKHAFDPDGLFNPGRVYSWM